MTERIEKTMRNLEKNNINAFFVQTKEEVVPVIENIVEEGSTVAVGGSVTLTEAGVLDHLRSGRYEFIDRYKEGLTPEEIEDVFRKSFSVDAYFCSSNAVTEDGELYNVDGNANRIGAIAFGPKKVVMIVGINKIVKNIDEAVKRVKTVAAPKNARRLNCKSYCNLKGHCMDMEGGIGKGCNAPTRICKHYLVSTVQKYPGRINVIFVNEELGY